MVDSSSVAFSPLQVGATRLEHRVVLAPCSRMRAEADHTASGEQTLPHCSCLEGCQLTLSSLTETMVSYYAQRASFPGTLLIAEASPIHPAAVAYAHTPGIWSDKHVAGWKKVVDAVHASGSKIFLQLWAPGRAADPAVLKGEEGGPYDVVGASGVPMVEGGVVPRALMEKEIEEYSRWFAEAAKRFVEGAGGDGVESKLASTATSPALACRS